MCDRKTLAVLRREIILTCNLSNLKFDDLGFTRTKLPPFGILIDGFVAEGKSESILPGEIICTVYMGEHITGHM